MKNFLKTIGYGIIAIFIAFISVAAIVCACLGLFVDLPAATGFSAVSRFIYSLLELAVGCVLVYGLGYGLLNEEV